jgi:hypothetical protein
MQSLQGKRQEADISGSIVEVARHLLAQYETKVYNYYNGHDCHCVQYISSELNPSSLS